MVHDKLIKVCGMMDGENIRQVELLLVDLIGFIFYPKSPRFVQQMPDYLPERAKRVGVFVNEEKSVIEMYADRFELDFIQLHGNESPEYCRTLFNNGYQIIKAFSIANRNDIKKTEEYEPYCTLFLFDTKCEQYGGSGNQFDWSILKDYKGERDFLLSGGINMYSAKGLNEFQHPRLAGYDLNSRFEREPGNKDTKRLKAFLEELKQI